MLPFSSIGWLQPSGLEQALDSSVFSPATPEAGHIESLFWLVIFISGVIFILVEGFVVYSVIRFRQRGERTAEPPQFYGSAPVEVAWTVAPFITVFVIFLVVTRTVAKMRHVDSAQDIRVEVVGHQWWWEYRYYGSEGPASKPVVTTAGELHVPTNSPVVLDLNSPDVIHSFWVPRLTGKTDVIPGRTNFMTFRVDEPGTFVGQCGEYCGTQHANMLIRVVADTPEEFASWLAHQKEPARPDPSAQDGRDTFMSLACSSCHTIRGTEAQGENGPDLTHLMSRETLGGGLLENDRSHLVDWLLDTQTIKPGCLMPDMKLSKEQAGTIADFLSTLQ